MIITQEKINAEGYVVDEQGLVYSNDGLKLLGTNASLEADVIVIKDCTKIIEEDALYEEEERESRIKIIIPDSVEVIESVAFYGLNLSEVQLSKNIKKIGVNAFFSYTKTPIRFIVPETTYENLEIGSCQTNVDLLSHIRVLNLKLIYPATGDAYLNFKVCPDLESIIIESDNLKIAKGAFSGCGKLNYVFLNAETRIEDGAFEGKFAYLNKYVDLGLPSGNVWARVDDEGNPRFEVLANKAFAFEPSHTPTRDEMEELFSSCLWIKRGNGFVGKSKYNGQQVLLSKKDFGRIWEICCKDSRYEYEFVEDHGNDTLIKLIELVDIGYDMVTIFPKIYYGKDIDTGEVIEKPTRIILRRQIKL